MGLTKNSGADIHVAIDGNFHHRHRRSARDSPHFFDPSYILSKARVDKVGKRIESERKKPPRKRRRSPLDEALDECGRSHDAANESKQKASAVQFDDTGLMALVCRHDIPLFMANIDTPGEQQKYAVCLLEELFRNLPEQATMLALYDIGCQLDRSRQLVCTIPLSHDPPLTIPLA